MINLLSYDDFEFLYIRRAMNGSIITYRKPTEDIRNNICLVLQGQYIVIKMKESFFLLNSFTIGDKGLIDCHALDIGDDFDYTVEDYSLVSMGEVEERLKEEIKENNKDISGMIYEFEKSIESLNKSFENIKSYIKELNETES